MNPLALLEDVLRVSNPGDVPMTPDYKGALIGFLARCRTLLYALKKLVESDADDVGDMLIRSIYEHVVTARWMLLDPPTNFRWLFQDYVQHWVTMRNEHRPLLPGHTFLAEADVGELLKLEPEPRVLPPILNRARDVGLDGYYQAYRMYSASGHGTLAAAALGLNRTPEKNLRDVRLGLSCHLTLQLIEIFRREFGAAEDPEIAGIDKAILGPALATAAPEGAGPLFIIGPSSAGKGALCAVVNEWLGVQVVHIDEEFRGQERVWGPIETRLLELEQSAAPVLVDVGAGTQDLPELAAFLAPRREWVVLVTDIPEKAFERNVEAGHRTPDQIDNYREVEYTNRRPLYVIVPKNHRVNQRGRALREGPADEFCQLVASLFMEAALRAARGSASA